MRYFIIAGEASGDLHGALLIEQLRALDPQAQFCFFGGDRMQSAAGIAPAVHYQRMAYMGFIEVAKHLREISSFLHTATNLLTTWHPDVVVLIDYPSFNLKVAKQAAEQHIPVHYFISPKIWVWKKWRITDIRRYVSRVHCILPFEPTFYRNNGYANADYAGNPTVAEIARAREEFVSKRDFCLLAGLPADRDLIALLPGSRKKEIRDNLPVMVAAAAQFAGNGFTAVIAGAPGLEADYYRGVLPSDYPAPPLLFGQTWQLVAHSRAALVVSGTATLETALLGTPQVACYRMNGSRLLYTFYRMLLTGKYVTLPNIIANEPVIPELLLHRCTVETMTANLRVLLNDTPQRTAMLAGYRRTAQLLGTDDCAAEAARRIIVDLQPV